MRRGRGWRVGIWVCVATLGFALVGCGTTRRTDTTRTATEQLLISDAIDQGVAQLNFAPLAGKDVYLDTQYIKGAVDESYLVSTLRQQLLHQGCLLRQNRDDAAYIVEARVGALGTDRHDLMLGIPSINLPSMVGMMGVPTSIPEVPVAKSTTQKAVAKVAVFAYNRETGRPIWQSGAAPVASRAKDTWILGAGPIQRGTIYSGTRFAGGKLVPQLRGGAAAHDELVESVTGEAIFVEGREEVATARETPHSGDQESDVETVHASYEEDASPVVESPDKDKSEPAALEATPGDGPQPAAPARLGPPSANAQPVPLGAGRLSAPFEGWPDEP